jgi:hypothetical protein
MKIWRSNYVWSKKKGRRNINEPIHVSTTKFDILEKLKCLDPKPEHLVFTVIRWSIFLNGGQLYIFHKCNHAGIFLRLCTCFSNNFLKFHSRNKEALQTTRIWTQTEDFKSPIWSPHRDDQNGYMERMIWRTDEEVMTFWRCSTLKTGGSGLGNQRVRFARIKLESK